MMNPQILHVSLDFDGCSDRSYSREIIIDNIIKTCGILTNIHKIVLMIGSLRQSVVIDMLNTIGHSNYQDYVSCEILYSDFLPLLKEKIAMAGMTQIKEIEFSPLLINDIYNKLDTGETFLAIQEIFSRSPAQILEMSRPNQEYFVYNQKGERVNLLSETDSHHMADCSKQSIIYMQAHHLKLAHPESEILFQFYDDRVDILNGLHQFFQSSQESLPSAIHLELFQCESLPNYKPYRFKEIIKGLGSSNPNFHGHILRTAELMQWQNIHIENPKFKALLETALAQPMDIDFHLPYKPLAVPAMKKRAFIDDNYFFRIHKPIHSSKSVCDLQQYPAIFELGYKLECHQRQSGYGRAYWETHAELESLLDMYSIEEQDEIREQIEKYVEDRLSEDRQLCDVGAVIETIETKNLLQAEEKLDALIQPFTIQAPKPRKPIGFFRFENVDGEKANAQQHDIGHS